MTDAGPNLRERFANLWAYFVLAVLVSVAVAIVVDRFEDDASSASAVVYVIFEGIVTFVALLYLQLSVEQQEWTTLRAMVRSQVHPREALVGLLDSALERIDAAYATAVNVLFALGMIGSAGFFVFYFDQSQVTSTILSIAPKAFTSTAFALCCGAVISLRARIPFVPRLCRLAYGGAVTTVAPALANPRSEDDSAEIKALGKSMVSAVREFSDISRAFTQHLNRLSTSVGELNEAIARRDAQHAATMGEIRDLVVRVESASTAIAGAINEPLTTAVARAAVATPKLLESTRDVAQGLQTVSQVLREERNGLLSQHGETLAAKSAELLEQLLARTETVIQTKLEAITGTIHIKATEAYDTAYKAAAASLRDILGSAAEKTEGISSGLTRAVAGLQSVVDLIDALTTAMHQGAETATDTTVRYAEAVARLRAAAENLAAIHVDTDAAAFINDLRIVAESVRTAAANVADALAELTQQKNDLAFAKSHLIEIARRPLRVDHG